MLNKKDLLSIEDLSKKEIISIIKNADNFYKNKKISIKSRVLNNHTQHDLSFQILQELRFLDLVKLFFPNGSINIIDVTQNYSNNFYGKIINIIIFYKFNNSFFFIIMLTYYNIY